MLATPLFFLPSFLQIIACPGQSAVVLAGGGSCAERRVSRREFIDYKTSMTTFLDPLRGL